jgi:hypothetical protein
VISRLMRKGEQRTVVTHISRPFEAHTVHLQDRCSLPLQ